MVSLALSLAWAEANTAPEKVQHGAVPRSAGCFSNAAGGGIDKSGSLMVGTPQVDESPWLHSVLGSLL